MNINMSTAKELVLDVLKAKLVPFLSSSPGIGKSALAKEIANEHNLKMIDLRLSQMDPADLNGFPTIQGNKAGYIPMNVFPVEGDEVPEGYKGWLILLDEFNSAAPSVQGAAYKIVLDRQVGMHNLHSNVAMMAAGNLMTDKAIVNRISTAMQSRLVHFTIDGDHKVWIKWADKNNIDHRVKSFINFKTDALHKFDPNHNEETFPCPRTWEFVSRLISEYPSLPLTKLPLIAGTIGEGMAREFMTYTQIYTELPTVKDIMLDPANISFGDEPSIHYALSGMVASHMDMKTIDILIVFLKRLSIDFQVIALRSAIAKNKEINKSKAVKDWIKLHANELM